jgi:tRNA modification GTPase
MPYFSLDDIVQIGTPPGQAAVGAVRVSGPGTFAILARTTKGIESLLANPERTVRQGELLIPLSTFADSGEQNEQNKQSGTKRTFACPARFFLMPAPASYTREHSAEIHIPASRALLKAALAALVEAGARAAAPGEFTFRAFRNGRITLGQAEAVEEVVRAENAAERRQALSRLGDGASGKIAAWRDRLADIAARIEAALDFSEEDIDSGVIEELARMARELDDAGATIADSAQDASAGLPHIALTGLANAGKSSLFNALLGENAVLVSPEASTTRDSLRRETRWNGVGFVLSDNPGYHADGRGGAGDSAAARAFGALGGEDAACWVVDASRPLDETAKRFALGLSGKIVIALNKTDLPERAAPEEPAAIAAGNGVTVVAVVRTSSFTGAGLDELRDVLSRTASSLRTRSFWNERERLELSSARECCRAAAAELNGAARLELAAEDARRGLAAFSRALGEGYAEETLGRIFSRFCIGK